MPTSELSVFLFSKGLLCHSFRGERKPLLKLNAATFQNEQTHQLKTQHFLNLVAIWGS